MTQPSHQDPPATTPDRPAQLTALPKDLDEVELGALATSMGMRLTIASAERVVMTMPVAGNTQPFGLLHGGASAALCETAASVAAAIHAGVGRTAVGIEINATHHRGAREGDVTAVATALHLGRTLASYDVSVTDVAGTRVCTSRVTCAIRDLR